jgi:hypothetical protein
LLLFFVIIFGIIFGIIFSKKDDISAAEAPALFPNSPLPSYLASALQKVNENKKLRAQLKSSIEPDTSTSNGTSTLLHPPAIDRNGTTSSTTPHSEKKLPTVYTIDSDDENEGLSSKPNNKSNSTKVITNTNYSTSSVSSSNTYTSSSGDSSVLFYVYSSPNDQQPLKFRCLKVYLFGLISLLTTHNRQKDSPSY